MISQFCKYTASDRSERGGGYGNAVENANAVEDQTAVDNAIAVENENAVEIVLKNEPNGEIKLLCIFQP